MEQEHLEAKLASMHEALVENLLDAVRSEECSANDKRLALDLIKYNHVRDIRPKPESKIPDLEEELPFSSLAQEIE